MATEVLDDRPPAGVTRTVDIAMIATRSPRRERFLAGAASQLWEWRTDLRLYDPRSAADAPTDDVLGAATARSRIVIDVGATGSAPCDRRQLLAAAANGCVVVTDRTTGLGPFLPGEHVLVAPFEYLAEQAVALALDEPRRARIAAAARRLAAELTPDPVTSPVPEAPVPSPPTGALRAARRAVRSLLPRTTAGVEELAQLDALVGELKRSYLAQTEQTRSVERALAILEHGDADACSVATTSAWAGTEPAVSVVVPITGPAIAPDAALRSSAGAAAMPCEIVIVDDRGAADVGGGAPDPLPALLDELDWLAVQHVRRVARGGWGVACRRGVAAARASHVLLLDPAERLRPNALRLLHERLLAAPPDVVATFGIVEQFDDFGATGLRGHLGWDVEVLVRERCVDTVAMFRGEALAELLDRPSTPAITGWERHDLWLALAERGWRAEPVGAVVASAADPGPGVGDIDEPATWLALYERHPRLPWPS